MQDCSTLKADWEKLAKMISIFDSPTAFAYHVGKDLLVNGVQIYGEITTAISDYNAGNWGDFGFQIGEAAAKTILGEEQETFFDVIVAEQEEQIDNKMVAEFAQGLLETTQVGEFNFSNLLTCIMDADQAAMILYKAVEMLEDAYKNRDINEAVGGLMASVAFVSQLEKSLPVCEAVITTKQDWTHFIHIVNVLEDPINHMAVIEKDIVFNGKTITADIG
jgi:hypothetical protein